MSIFRLQSRAATCLIGAAILISACGGDAPAEGQLQGTVQVDGSSTVYPVSEAIGEEFAREYPRVRVPVGVSGTGGGFNKFLRSETDINGASRPIKPSEVQLAEQNDVTYIELPVAYDGLAIVANPQNDWLDCVTVEELRAIWEPGSTVRSWNQVRDGFPNRPLVLYGPGTDSGTYDYFTEAIVGEEGASRADFTASEDDNVLVQGIQGDQNALGFFGMAYYEENQDRLKLVGVDDGDPSNGQGCIEPTTETVRNGSYEPLSRPLFIYVRQESAQDEIVRTFVNFYLDNAASLVGDVGYVPLSDEAYELAKERFAKGVRGSLFAHGDTQVGASLEDMMRRDAAADTVSHR